MKTLKESILSSTNTGKRAIYTLFPKNKTELVKMIEEEIRKNGNECSLNHIYTGKITDMSYLFLEGLLCDFNGDISGWNVSNVENMTSMFSHSKFNGDISGWNVSKVENMYCMFFASIFNGDISKWNVSKVKNMESMFHISKFNQNISKWNVSNVKNMESMFAYSNFNSDISSWKINPKCDINWMFYGCKIKDEYKPKLVK